MTFPLPVLFASTAGSTAGCTSQAVCPQTRPAILPCSVARRLHPQPCHRPGQLLLGEPCQMPIETWANSWSVSRPSAWQSPVSGLYLSNALGFGNRGADVRPEFFFICLYFQTGPHLQPRLISVHDPSPSACPCWDYLPMLGLKVCSASG